MNTLQSPRLAGAASVGAPTASGRHYGSRRFLMRVLVVLVLLAGGFASALQAASLPNGTQRLSLTAREQPVADFLQTLFSSVGVPADIAPDVAGTVNGTFSGQARKVFADIARVYNLVGYYDGAVMHVVPARSLTRRTYAVHPADADRMLRVVAEFDLTDVRNTVRRASDGSIQAFGTRRFIEQVDELFNANAAREQAPAAPAPADFAVFHLRYAWAQDVTMTIGGRQVVVPGVASILRSLVGAEPSQGLGRERLLSPTVPGLRGQGLAARGRDAAGTIEVSDGGARERDAQGTALDALVSALARTAAPAAPASQPALEPAVDQVRIQADPRLNAIIVRDRADRLPRYEQLIAALDVEPQSVEIEATIIDVNTDRMRELGVDWRLSHRDDQAGFSGGIPTQGIGGVASVVLGSATRFFARIRALQAEGAARIVSSPQVVTLSNVEAVFDNTSTFYVRVAGREDVDLFNVSAGTSLRVTPNVFADRDGNRIKLMVQVEDGNLTGRQVDQIPIVERSSINTQALIREGESLLIGGMVRDSASSTVDKVPVLGDVPVVGNLFRTEGRANSRIERMFLITPRVSGSRGGQGAHTRYVEAPAAGTPVAQGDPRRATPYTGTRAGPAPAAGYPVASPAAPVAAPAAPARVPARRPSVVVDLETLSAAARGVRPVPARQAVAFNVSGS